MCKKIYHYKTQCIKFYEVSVKKLVCVKRIQLQVEQKY